MATTMSSLLSFPGRPSIEQFLQLANAADDASRYADVTLIVGSSRIRCHKLLLAAHSHFLRDLFLERDGLQEEDCVITLAEAQLEEVEGVLAFAYSGSVLDDRLLEYGLRTLRLVGSGDSKECGTTEDDDEEKDDQHMEESGDKTQKGAILARRKGRSNQRRRKIRGEKKEKKKTPRSRLECCDESFDDEIFYVTHKVRAHSAATEQTAEQQLLLPGGRDQFIICCDEKITDTFKGHLEETHKLDESDKSVCCDNNFDNLQGLTRHCATRHGLRLSTFKRVVCCATRLNSLEEYKRHKEQDSAHLECKLCAFMSKDERHLSLHLYTKHNVGTKPPPLTCKFCGKSFRRSHLRQDHEDRHDDRPKYSCEVCNKSFRLVSSLRSHLYRMGRNHNPESKEYSCDSCDKTFNTVVAKRKHTRGTHEQRETPTCSECEMTFVDRHSLDNHFKVAHVKIKDIQCPYCGKLFTTQDRMRVHERFVHVVEVEKIPCDVCNKEFCNKERMIDHRRSVHRDRKYQCESCGSTFKNSSTLKSHVVSIHLDHDKKPLKCIECGKGFLHESRLRAHEMIHSDEAKFACQFCCRPNKCKNNNIKHERRCKKRAKATATDASGTLVSPPIAD